MWRSWGTDHIEDGADLILAQKKVDMYELFHEAEKETAKSGVMSWYNIFSFTPTLEIKQSYCLKDQCTFIYKLKYILHYIFTSKEYA